MGTGHLLELLGTGRFEFDLSLHVLAQQNAAHLAQRYDRFLTYLAGGPLPPPTTQTSATGVLLPATTKADVRALEAVYIRLAKERRLWRKYTSGTTGPRTSVFYDDKFFFEQLFVCVRKVCALGGFPLQRHDRVLSVMGNTGRGDELFVDPCLDGLIYVRIGCDERAPASLHKLCETLELFAPNVVTLKPSLAQALAVAARRLGLKLPFREVEVVVSSGQRLNALGRSAIGELFGGKVIDALITSEAGLIAGKDRDDDAWLIDRSALEVVRPDSDCGPLRVTSEANAMMPLRGYFIGDEIEFLYDERGRHRLRMVEGRQAAVASFISGLTVDLSRFDSVAFEIIGASDYRLTCWPDRVSLETFNSRIADVEIQAATEQFFGSGLRIDVVQRDLSDDQRPRFSVEADS